MHKIASAARALSFLFSLTAARAEDASPPAAETKASPAADAALVLDGTGYFRQFTEFGLMRLSSEQFRKDGERLFPGGLGGVRAAPWPPSPPIPYLPGAASKWRTIPAKDEVRLAATAEATVQGLKLPPRKRPTDSAKSTTSASARPANLARCSHPLTPASGATVSRRRSGPPGQRMFLGRFHLAISEGGEGTICGVVSP